MNVWIRDICGLRDKLEAHFLGSVDFTDWARDLAEETIELVMSSVIVDEAYREKWYEHTREAEKLGS